MEFPLELRNFFRVGTRLALSVFLIGFLLFLPQKLSQKNEGQPPAPQCQSHQDRLDLRIYSMIFQ
jgi:hypothetical protein